MLVRIGSLIAIMYDYSIGPSINEFKWIILSDHVSLLSAPNESLRECHSTFNNFCERQF